LDRIGSTVTVTIAIAISILRPSYGASAEDWGGHSLVFWCIQEKR
jgi:hypothetical protein